MMKFQSLILLITFFCILVLPHENLSSDDPDYYETTVTDPSVFHDEHKDLKITLIGSVKEALRPPLQRQNALNFAKLEGKSDTSDSESSDARAGKDSSSSSSSDSSDAPGTNNSSSSSSSSDANQKGDLNVSSGSNESTIDSLVKKTKNIGDKTSKELKKQQKIFKVQSKRTWQALKQKIIREAEMAQMPPEKLRDQLKKAKREAKQAWKDLKNKIKNGNDALNNLMENSSDLNSNDKTKNNESKQSFIENDTKMSAEYKI